MIHDNHSKHYNITSDLPPEYNNNFCIYTYACIYIYVCQLFLQPTIGPIVDIVKMPFHVRNTYNFLIKKGGNNCSARMREDLISN